MVKVCVNNVQVIGSSARSNSLPRSRLGWAEVSNAVTFDVSLSGRLHKLLPRHSAATRLRFTRIVISTRLENKQTKKNRKGAPRVAWTG